MHTHYVIPAYHESPRLPAYLEELASAIQTSRLTITLQVVDDGSGQLEQNRLNCLLEPLQRKYPFILPSLLLEKNLGKGGAVYTGWQKAPHCDLLGFVDADGSISANELIRLTQLASTQPESAIFGSRVLMLGKTIKRSFFRHYLGRIFATCASILLNVPVYDSQCGIKLLPFSVHSELSNDCLEHGFAFDMELLMLLRRNHCRIVEEPINWEDTPGSKVVILRDSIHMLLTLLRLRQRFLHNSSHTSPQQYSS